MAYTDIIYKDASGNRTNLGTTGRGITREGVKYQAYGLAGESGSSVRRAALPGSRMMSNVRPGTTLGQLDAEARRLAEEENQRLINEQQGYGAGSIYDAAAAGASGGGSAEGGGSTGSGSTGGGLAVGDILGRARGEYRESEANNLELVNMFLGRSGGGLESGSFMDSIRNEASGLRGIGSGSYRGLTGDLGRVNQERSDSFWAGLDSFREIDSGGAGSSRAVGSSVASNAILSAFEDAGLGRVAMNNTELGLMQLASNALASGNTARREEGALMLSGLVSGIGGRVGGSSGEGAPPETSAPTQPVDSGGPDPTTPDPYEGLNLKEAHIARVLDSREATAQLETAGGDDGDEDLWA